MACRSIVVDGIQVVVCGPRRRSDPCSTPGCHSPHTKLCSYPVVRAGQAGTCDAKLCDRCATRVGEADYCKPHANLHAKKEHP